MLFSPILDVHRWATQAGLTFTGDVLATTWMAKVAESRAVVWEAGLGMFRRVLKSIAN